MLPKCDLKLEPLRVLPVSSLMMSIEDRTAIVALLNGIRAQSIIEIGVHEGITARTILDNVPTIAEYTGIDVYPDYVPKLKWQRGEVSEHAGHFVRNDPRFTLVIHDGVLSIDIRPIDAMLIDGDHSEAAVKIDSEFARMCVKPGGLIIWHDYWNGDRTDVRKTLDRWHVDGRQIFHVPDTWVAFEKR